MTPAPGAQRRSPLAGLVARGVLAAVAGFAALSALPGPAVLTRLAGFAGFAAAAPVDHAASPAAGRFFSVWMPYWSLAAAESSTFAHAAEIGTASPVWYTAAADGTVRADPGAGDAGLVEALRTRGIAVVPTVSEASGLAAFDRMLVSPDRRAALVRGLVAVAGQAGYAGLDLDFEQFAVDPAGVRSARAAGAADAAAAGYPGFVAEVCRALHAIARTCTVTVMPRTSAAHTLWRRRLATWVYDYRALGAVADRVRIMAYDDHAPDSAPGPVAPLGWVEQVIAFARSQLPPARAELGLAAYGYAWGPRRTNTFAANQAAGVAAAAGALWRWSPQAGEAYLRSGPSGHLTVAWYENARADRLREGLAAAAGFAGVALWAAGDETPGLWTAAP